MGLPSKKRPSSEKHRRASHFALTRPVLTSCKNCGKPSRPHHVCAFCGTYNGRKVLTVRSRAEKQLRRREQQRKKADAAESAPEAAA